MEKTDDEKIGELVKLLDLETKKLFLNAIEKAEKDGDKNAPFLQWSKSWITPVQQLAREKPSAHQVLLTMLNMMDRTNSLIATHSTLASYSKLSVATIKTSIKYLIENQWIDIAKEGNFITYHVNSRPFWQTTPHGREARFNATIILSDNGQQAIADQKKHPLKRVPILGRPHRAQTLILDDENKDQGELDV
jgi:hypothetical protein